MQTEIFLAFIISTVVFLYHYRKFYYESKQKTFTKYLELEASFFIESWLVLYRAMCVLFLLLWIINKIIDLYIFLFNFITTSI